MMPDIRTILLAAGLGKDTDLVLRYTIDLAQKYQAKIQLIHSHEAPDISAQSMAELYMFQQAAEDSIELAWQAAAAKLQTELEQRCQQELKRLSAPAELIAGINISQASPKNSILQAAKEFSADLIVIGSHRHSVLTDALLGSTAMRVLHSATVPVFVVRII